MHRNRDAQSQVPVKIMDLKKAYYYIICLVALFVLMWGAVDLASAGIGLATAKEPGITALEKEGGASVDIYYQKRMLYDRLTDSLARIVISGLVFIYCRKKAD